MKKKKMSFFKNFMVKIDFEYNKKKILIITISLIVIIILCSLIIAKANKITLTCKDAEAIALKQLGGGAIIKCERERKKYEVEILYNNYEYEFIINAKTGDIIEYDSDYQH